MRHVKFLLEVADMVFNGIPGADHPDCPECDNGPMDYYGGEVPWGEGYWECPECGYTFTENDIEEYRDEV